MNWKVIIKPALSVIDMALDGLAAAIKSGNTEKALSCIEKIRTIISEISKML